MTAHTGAPGEWRDDHGLRSRIHVDCHSDGLLLRGGLIRLVAFVIDLAVLNLLPWMLGDVLHASGPDSAGQFWHPGEHGWATILLGAAVKATFDLGWLAGWQAAAGGTPGMKALRLRVLAPSGKGNPSIGAAAMRYLWIQVAAFCAMVSANPGIYEVVGNGKLPVLAGLLTLLIWLTIGITTAKSPTRQIPPVSRATL